LEELSLGCGKSFRRVNDYSNQLVALAAVKMFYALLAYTVDSTRLCARLNLDLALSVKGRYIHVSAQGGGGERDGELDHDIVADALEQVVGLFSKFDVHIAAAPWSPVAFAA